MNTFNINQHGITVKDEFGNTTMIRTSSAKYVEAKEAVMCADWSTFYRLAETTEMDEVLEDIAEMDDELGDIILIGGGAVGGMAGLIEMLSSLEEGFAVVDDSPEFEANDEFTSPYNHQCIGDVVDTIKGLLEDEAISLDTLGISIPAVNHEASHEHDLSNWNGSPIFYPTREMARAQSDRWGMFWEYHDFGIASPPGYRYATVPRGVGPTAPEGYDWVCLPHEE